MTAHAAGYYPASATANSIQVTIGAAPTMVTLPKITGSSAIGSILTVSPGVWSLDGLTISYQWYQFDPSSHAQTLIPGATNSTYTVNNDVDNDLGLQLYCSVTVSRDGYTSKSVTTALTGVVFS